MATTYLLDHFTDTDTTALQSHTMDTGAGWTILSGTWEVLTNKAVRASISFNEKAVSDAGVANVMVQATINTGTFGTNYYVGLVARATDDSNCWICEIFCDSGQANLINLVQVNSGSYTTEATSSSFTIAASTSYTVQLWCEGNTISLIINGTQVIQYQSATFNNTATKFGIIGSVGTAETQTYDDFSVVSLPQPAPPAHMALAEAPRPYEGVAFQAHGWPKTPSLPTAGIVMAVAEAPPPYPGSVCYIYAPISSPSGSVANTYNWRSVFTLVGGDLASGRYRR